MTDAHFFQVRHIGRKMPQVVRVEIVARIHPQSAGVREGRGPGKGTTASV